MRSRSRRPSVGSWTTNRFAGPWATLGEDGLAQSLSWAVTSENLVEAYRTVLPGSAFEVDAARLSA